MDGMRSAADDVPALLLGLSADARPAMLLVGKQVTGAFDVGDHVSSSSLEGLGAGNYSLFDIDSALNFESFGALCVVVEIVEGRLGFEVLLLSWLKRVEGE